MCVVLGCQGEPALEPQLSYAELGAMAPMGGYQLSMGRCIGGVVAELGSIVPRR